MDCRECSSEMTAFLDGELPQSRGRQVRSHIDACLACTADLNALREAADLVHAHHRKLEPHPAGWNRVLVRLDGAGKASRHGWLALLFTRWQPVAISLIGFGLALGLWSYQRHIDSQRALEHYMTQYVQVREAQERSHRHQAPKPTGGKFAHPETPGSENPFLLIHQTTQGNPFRR